MSEQEDLQKIRDLIAPEILRFYKKFTVNSEGYFFASQRDDQFAPFKIRGYCPKEGLYPDFIACTDEVSAKMLLGSFDIRQN